MSEISDVVFDAARSGDRDAIAALVRDWHRPIRAFVGALLLGSQDVDDVAQEVFLRALERLDRVTDADAFGPFLRGIARNVVRERRRKYAREGRAFASFVNECCQTDAAGEKASWLADPELLAALRFCLDGLPDRSREMLALRYTEELTSDQIGQQVGLNATAVRTAMRRARVTLLQCIQSNYGPALEPM
jgi:RNA polymerase sigma-70 factor (ECF subfamily)